MKFSHGFGWIASLLCLVAVSACAPSTHPLPDEAKGVVKLGKPYVINGKQYYPSYEPEYDKIGEASWYGPGFHGKSTANGERFNENDVTAAHTTLPMPSFVRVTNLENGKSIMVRINDRGPFKSNRIIDLSSRAADELGVKSRGTAQVRVQYLKKESDDYIAMLKGEQPSNGFAHDTPAVSDEDYRATQIGNPEGDQLMDNRATGSAAPVAMVATNELPPIAGLPALAPAANQPEPVIRRQSDQYATAPMTPQIGGEGLPATLPPASAPVPVIAAAPQATPAQPPMPEPVQIASANSTAQAAIGGGMWYVQAGAFSVRENAQKLQHKLDALGKTSLSEIAVDGKTWYRVRLGPMNDRGEAQSRLGDVVGMGLPDAKIVRN